MKRNSFYLCVAAVAFFEVAIFWLSVELADPLPSVIAIVLGILGIYLAKMYIDEVIEDERTQKITEITALRTLQITWVGLFLFALWIIIDALGEGDPAFQPAIRYFRFPPADSSLWDHRPVRAIVPLL